MLDVNRVPLRSSSPWARLPILWLVRYLKRKSCLGGHANFLSKVESCSNESMGIPRLAVSHILKNTARCITGFVVTKSTCITQSAHQLQSGSVCVLLSFVMFPPVQYLSPFHHSCTDSSKLTGSEQHPWSASHIEWRPKSKEGTIFKYGWW